MTITTIQPSKQLYTLLVTDNQTKQQSIALYNSSPVLTTELDELLIYTQRLAFHFGTEKTYVISMVTPIDMNDIVRKVVEQYKD